MQKKAKEVTLAVTSHNQNNNRNNANAEHKPQQTATTEVVHRKPKTTTNRTNTKQNHAYPQNHIKEL